MLQSLEAITGLTVEKLELFFLVLVRMSFIVFLLPAFSVREVPSMVKAGLSLMLAIMVWPMLPPFTFAVQGSVVFFLILVLEQCVVGAIIGFSATFLLHFLHVGGHFMARDIGISSADAIDPITDEPTEHLTAFLSIIFMVIFLIEGHHMFFFRVLFDSFTLIPVGMFSWDMEATASILVLLSASSLVVGFKIAAPIMATLFIGTVGMGLMARVMPEMNIWIVGIPIKIILGVLALIYVFPMMAQVFDMNFEQLQQAMMALLRVGGPVGSR